MEVARGQQSGAGKGDEMKRGAPMKRTAFARKSNSGSPSVISGKKEAENTLSKAPESHASKEQAAIIVVVKSKPQTAICSPPAAPVFRGSIPKSQPVRNEAYRRLVAALPCVICGIAGQSQAAHGSGAGTAVCKGMGLKSCDLTCFPACVRDHAAIDQGALFTKTVRHALEPTWAADTQRKIHAMGKWPKGIPYPFTAE